MRGILLFTLCGIFCTTAFAHQIHQGQLISHKEWGSPGVHGESKVLQEKPMKTPQRDSHHDYNELISPHTSLNAIDLHLGENKVSGRVALTLANETSTPQSYTITSELCVYLVGPGYESNCFNVEDIVTLNNFGSIDYAIRPSQIYNFTSLDYTYGVELFLDVKNNATKTVVRTSSLEWLKPKSQE